MSEQPKSELPIIYQDEHLVAIDKPAGLLVHRSLIDKRETRFALQMERDQIGQHVFPVHRLDRPTSGVLLFALSSDIARIVGESFASHQVAKSYYAIVRGFAPQVDVIDYPLKEILDKKADKMANKDKAPQEAVTQYHCIAQSELPLPVGRYDSVRYSLLKLQPQTGRKHQLRRHMAHIRHPILGDTTHGDGKQNAFFFNHFGYRRMMLMAHSLSLPHPVTKAKITLTIDPDEQWLSAFEKLGWNNQVI
ncbi:MAG: tRNA pseudouridine(65) synthase TruC [Psychrosphaera sp.]|nr:tRNA pseudouridine(65) synthase TruC [Psychrosphaera sp.]